MKSAVFKTEARCRRWLVFCIKIEEIGDCGGIRFAIFGDRGKLFALKRIGKSL